MIVCSALTLAGCKQAGSPNQSKSGEGVDYYTCSMHPSVKESHADDCPFCGMKLAPVKGKKSSGSNSLQTQNSTRPKTSEKKVEYWTCSMHPQIKADKPGNCPICGMQLVPVYTSSAAGGEGSKSSDQGEVYLTDEGIRQSGVRVEPVQTRQLAKELLIFGTIGYNQNLHRDVVPLVGGRIERQLVDFNQTEVKEGDPLVVLYSTEALSIQEEYLKALRERWLSTFYERKLLDSMISLAEEKLRRIGFKDDDLQKLEHDQKPHSEIIIRSPIAGSIVGNMVHIGETAKTDMPLYHIVPLDELWFNAQVFEPDLALLKIGQTVRITTKSFPGEEFTGKLSFIGRSLEASNRTISVRFTVPNPNLRLLPNLSASGQLEIQLGKSVLSAPNSAVLDLGTRHVVYVQKEKGVYVSRNVRVGHVTPHFTQILNGLSEGDQVVTAGAFLLDAQSQLRAAGTGGGGDSGQGTDEMLPPPAGQHHH